MRKRTRIVIGGLLKLVGLACVFGFHDEPVRSEGRRYSIGWVCPQCQRTIGESRYVPNPRLLRDLYLQAHALRARRVAGNGAGNVAEFRKVAGRGRQQNV